MLAWGKEREKNWQTEILYGGVLLKEWEIERILGIRENNPFKRESWQSQYCWHIGFNTINISDIYEILPRT